MPGYAINPQIQQVITPPIAEVQGWVDGRCFSAERPLLDVCQAVPSYGPAASLLEHVAHKLRDPASALYTDILGLPELRTALAQHLSQDYAGEVDAGQVAITAGCNQAFCVAIDTVAQPGDEVILLLPYYFNHYMWLQMRGIRSAHVPFNPDGPPRLDDVACRISAATRAIVLITPNNPTGIEYRPDFVAGAFDLAQAHGLALIIDETYKDFRTRTGPPHALLQRADWDSNLIQLHSFSKSYAMTGYRVGAIVAGEAFNHEVEKVLDNLVICPSHIGQLAARYGLEHLESWRRNKADLLRDRVSRLRECFACDDLHYRLASSGAYFAYVRHPFAGQAAPAVARRLAEEFSVLCLPGSVFGPGQDAYLRFAFANLSAEYIPQLVTRLIESQSE